MAVESTEEDLTLAMRIPDTYESIFIKARVHSAEGELEEAALEYKRLSDRLANLKPELWKRRPQLRDMYYASLAEQARIHHVLGNLEQSLALYRQLDESGAPGKTLWRREAARVLIDMGHVEQGLDELRAEAVTTPGNHENWLVIGLECKALGRWEEAEENLKRAVRNALTSESKQESYLALFDLYRSQGRIEDAITVWAQAWEDETEPSDTFPVYQMLIESGQLERAREYLERETNPLRRGFYQGLCEARQGRAREAERRWKKVAEMKPFEFEDGHEEWAEAALRTNSPPEEVIRVLEKSANAKRLTPRGIVLLAAAEARLGHANHVEKILKRACLMKRGGRPRRERLSAEEWSLFSELVAEPGASQEFKNFFDGGS